MKDATDRTAKTQSLAWRRSAVVWLAGALVAGFFALAAHLVFSHHYHTQAVDTTTGNLTQVVESRLVADLDRNNAVLAYLAGQVDTAALQPAYPAAEQAALTRRLGVLQASFPFLTALQIMDAEGVLRYSSDPVAPRVDVSDRPHFQLLRDDPTVAITFSEVIVARTTGERSIVQLRALRDEQGRFLGTVNALVSLEEISRLLAAIETGPGGLTLLLHRDTSALIAHQSTFGAWDVNWALPLSDPIRQRVDAGVREGGLAYTASTDGVQRFGHFKVMADYPFYVHVAIAKADYLAAWRDQATFVAGLAFMMLLGFWMALRYLRTSAVAEQAGLDEQQRLHAALLSVADFAAKIQDAHSLEATTAFVARQFDVDYVHIALLEPDATQARVVARYLDGEAIASGSVVAGADTPYVKGGASDPEGGPQKRIAPDSITRAGERSIEEPILDSKGQMLGKILLVSRGSLVESEVIAAGLRVLAARVATDLARQHSEQALRISEEKHRLLFETMPQGVVYRGGDGSILSANPAAERILGLSLAQMRGEVSTDPRWQVIREDGLLVPDDDQPDRVALKTGRIVGPVTLGVRHPDQQADVWLSVIATPQFRAGETAPFQAYVTLEDITARKRSESAANELSVRLQKLASHLQGFIYQYQRWPDGRSAFPYASSAIEIIYGVSAEAVYRDAGKVFALLHPDDRESVRDSIRISADTLSVWKASYRIRHPDGRLLWVEGQASPERQPDGSTLWHGYIYDITERKQAETALQESEERLKAAQRMARIGHWELNLTTDRLEWSDEVFRIFERDPETFDPSYRNVLEIIHPEDRETVDATFQRALAARLPQVIIVHRLPCADGRIKHVKQQCENRFDDAGRPLSSVGTVQDITAQHEHEQQLQYIAHYDTLTGLPNRVLLADRLHQAMAQSARRQSNLAIAYIDLDGFKTVNDTHGHEVGDRLLCVVSERMRNTLRDGDSLARLGGDEFIAVLLDLPDAEGCVPTLNRLLDAASREVLDGGRALRVSASVGVTFYPQPGDIDADQLLRQADQAMYQAKLAGKNRYHFFDLVQDQAVRSYHEELVRIRQALNEREFVLHYQPKVNMRTGDVVGMEALIRWQHPERGLLPPAAFLPLIENHRLAVAVGDWVIDTALAQIAAWRQNDLVLPVSVNVGARQLQQPDFVEGLQNRLAAYSDVPSGQLELEVLETSALQDIGLVSKIMEDCLVLGVPFALDDFGTGYSSLTYLKRLPARTLKIDQSFVRDMLEDPEDLAILEGVLGLAAAFRRQPIAEGVESIAHGEMLLDLGYDLAQGYGIARPMPAEEVPAWVASWQPGSRWMHRAPRQHADLPMLCAAVEHRAWIKAVVAYLQGQGAAPSVRDSHACRFGAWLDGEGRANHGTQAAFLDVEQAHLAVHDHAQALLELHAQGETAEALKGVAGLELLRDRLLAQLARL